MNSNWETMHPPGSAQDSLSTTILAAYMDPVRCDVKENKQETNHPNSIALSRSHLIDAAWIEPPSIRKSYECVCGLNRLITLKPLPPNFSWKFPPPSCVKMSVTHERTWLALQIGGCLD